jgi:glycosyltransferase involved in cell wall biosynthesis
MKVLLVSSGSGSRGGGEIFLDYLGKALDERGHEIIVWIPAHPRMDELADKCAQYATVLRADYRNTYDRHARSLSTCFNWATSRSIAREWESLRPDVIHLNKQNLEDGLDLLRAARQCAIPSICTIHLTQTAGYLRAQTPWLRDWIAQQALGKYRSVFVAVQEARRAALHQFLEGRAQTETIFNGVPLVDFAALRHVREAKRKELGLTDRDFLVLGLGRLVEQKRPFVFLKAAQELHRHFPAAKFVWIGDGNLAGQWNDWIARENLDGVITCAGWQSNTLPFLLAGDLLLHVAEYEGLPLAIIEAMAAGLPCAVTRNFASEIPLFDERSVLFLDDPQALAGKLRDVGMLRGVSAQARHLVENQLSIHAMSSSYERLYAGAIQAIQK